MLDQFAVEDEQGVVAKLLNRFEGVRYEQERFALLLQGAHPFEALGLEGNVADGEDFIDEEDIRINFHRDREAETHIHAAGVMLHWRVDKIFQPGEFHNVVHAANHILARDAKNGGVQDRVFTSGEFGMKARAEFEERGDAAFGMHAAGGGGHGSRDQAEQGAFA